MPSSFGLRIRRLIADRGIERIEQHHPIVELLIIGPGIIDGAIGRRAGGRHLRAAAADGAADANLAIDPAVRAVQRERIADDLAQSPRRPAARPEIHSCASVISGMRASLGAKAISTTRARFIRMRPRQRDQMLEAVVAALGRNIGPSPRIADRYHAVIASLRLTERISSIRNASPSSGSVRIGCTSANSENDTCSVHCRSADIARHQRRP